MFFAGKRKRLVRAVGLTTILLVTLAGCGSKTSQPSAQPGQQGATSDQAKTQTAGAPDYEFFKNKNIKFIVATNAGGGYDAYARLVAPYLQKYLPGSTVLVENVPGAGHVIGATQLWDAKPDGLTIATFNSGLIQQQIIGNPNIKFDLNKFTWLAKSTAETPVVITGNKSPYKTFEDMRKTQTTVKFGSAGVGSESHVDALVVSHVFKIPAKTIGGYGGQTGDVALIRGEIDGMEASYDSMKSFVNNGEGRILLQLGEKKHPELPDVPLANDLLKDDPQGLGLIAAVNATAAIGKPIAAPPNMPAERTAALIEALKKAYEDPELKEKAAKLGLSLYPAFGQDVADMVKKALNQPEDNVKVLKDILSQK